MQPHNMEGNIKRKKQDTTTFGYEEESSRKRPKHQDGRLYEWIHSGVLFDFTNQPTTTEEAAREVVKCLGLHNVESIELVPYLENGQGNLMDYDQNKTGFHLFVKIPSASVRLQAQDRGVRANKYPGAPLVYGIPIAAYPEILQLKKAGKHLSFDEIKRKKAE
ncbi:hypothetical protein BDB00DRAFT_927100 [Zychaea mexicana]|uniref:uncharacterized protein n=1 Tax=Zychaea mexicana TaxID=64656 RepID=UPI0022FF2C5D|nr:uncharacterized protein BDB00DRAFT_927100 [Zychaea mexicana]KAI9496054.1 hypothetical protein BDB00DRAFT_927100 [Zychaea mexicana]